MKLHLRCLSKASFLHLEGDRMLWVCPTLDALFRMREIVLSVLSMVQAISTDGVSLAQSQRSTWSCTNPTTNVHSEGCVKNKSWANSRNWVGWNCPVLMPDPSRAQMSGKPYWEHSRQLSIRGMGYIFILFLMRWSNLASCTFNISWKEAFLLTDHQGTAKHLHLHFMYEER